MLNKKVRPIVPDTEDWIPLPMHGPFGGLNLRDNPRSLVNQSPDLLNIDLTDDGIVETDLGFTLEGASGGTDPVPQLKSVYKSDGTKRLIRCVGTKIQCRDGSGWTDIATGLTSGKVWDFAVVNDTVYMVNGTDTPRKWGFDPGVASSTVAAIDNGTTILFMNDRLWTAGNDVSRINYSDLGDYEDFAGGGDVECYKKDSAGKIVGLRQQAERMIVYKERQKYSWDALTFGTLAFLRLGSQSTVSLRSIVEGDDGYHYFANRQGVWRHRGTTQDEYLSRDVEPEFEAMDQSKEANLAAIWFKREYWLGYTPSGQTVNTMVFRFKPVKRQWLWKDWAVSCFAVFEQSDGKQQLIFGSSSNSNVYKRYLTREDASYNHNGAAINAYYVLPYQTPSGKHRKNQWRHLFYQFDFGGNWYVRLGWRKTTIGGFREELVNLAPNTPLWKHDGSTWQRGGKFWAGQDIVEGWINQFSVQRCRGVEFRVAANLINQPFRFMGITPHFQPLEGIIK